MIPPTKWGMKPSLCGSPCREKTGWPVGKMIVVVAVVVVGVGVVVVVAAAAVESHYFFKNNYC